MNKSTDPSTSYSPEQAKHYSSYRPPLHSSILEKCIGARKYSFGLDIGCGTGQSTLALKQYCERVFGIEPSRSMIEKAIDAPGVTYETYDGLLIPGQKEQFDIITFAGSLYYAKSHALLAEVQRVLTSGGHIVIYDFEVDFNPVFEQIGKPPSEHYDHQVNLDDSHFSEFKEKEEQYTLTFDASHEELAHLVLSSDSALKFFQEKYDRKEPFSPILQEFLQLFEKSSVSLNALAYSCLYRVK